MITTTPPPMTTSGSGYEPDIQMGGCYSADKDNHRLLHRRAAHGARRHVGCAERAHAQVTARQQDDGPRAREADHARGVARFATFDHSLHNSCARSDP